MPWLLTLIALACDPGADADPEAAARVPVHTETLPNGLRVVIAPHHRTDTVAVHLHVGVGSRDESADEHGAAHLFEHLMYEGSAHAPGNSYDALLDAAGGTNNAYTTSDETAYWATFPSGALDLALFLESDRLGWLGEGLTDEALANQADVVLRERAQSEAAPHGLDAEALSLLVFPEGHPYHMPTLGTEAGVRGLTLEAARDFHARHYRPGNVVLGIAGHVEPEHALARVRHWFSDLPATDAPIQRVTGPLPARQAPIDAVIDSATEDWTVYLAWRAVPLNHPDEAALVLASFLLSDGRGTTLDQRWYDKDWIDDADARLRARELDGLFQVALSGDRPRIRRMTRWLEKAVDGLARRPPDPAALERAKRRVRSLILDRLETPQVRAETLVDCIRLTGMPGCVPDDLSRVDAVTPEEVSTAVARMLEQPRVRLVVVPSWDTTLADLLEDGFTWVEVP